ncbi:hypothetical protein KIL84_015770 [Mauremys mutica]|uniref:Secreted protein n=1 Tax=Mauremys mutica TaxID=74926 RepID=A0A9D3WSM2_9SAUR|nr:hypothetical protein KIL84_015770 [Mauremys mutica]
MFLAGFTLLPSVLTLQQLLLSCDLSHFVSWEQLPWCNHIVLHRNELLSILTEYSRGKQTAGSPTQAQTSCFPVLQQHSIWIMSAKTCIHMGKESSEERTVSFPGLALPPTPLLSPWVLTRMFLSGNWLLEHKGKLLFP